MPTLAGWITGEQVEPEVIAQTLDSMGEVLGQHGGQPATMIEAGVGLIAYSDAAYAMQHNDDPPVLDLVPDRRTLVYHRPLSGLHPLYYIQDWPAEGNLLFASEIKALLAVGVPRAIHLPALDALLRYGFIPAPWTMFKNIYSVPAGSILRWQRAKVVVNHASDFHLEEPLSGDIQELCYASLDEATEHMLPPHNDLVALVGGSHTAALAALLAARYKKETFQVATLAFKRSLAASIWRTAEDIAEACQRPFLAVTGVDQPEFWLATLLATETPCIDTRPMALHQLVHTISAETGTRVALCGLGGHAIFATPPPGGAGPGSDEKRQADPLSWYQQTLTPRTRRSSRTSNIQPGTTQPWSHDAAELLRSEEPWEDTLHARKLRRQAEKLTDAVAQHSYLHLHLSLPDQLVSTFQQIATQERMAVRTPYLNHHTLDMLARLPAIADDGTRKENLPSSLLQRHMPNMVEAAPSLRLSGPGISLRHSENSELVRYTLGPEALRKTGIFDEEQVGNLLQQAQTGQIQRELLLVFTTQVLCHLLDMAL